MRGDQQVIDYLNKALRHELAAVNQYWPHLRDSNWDFAKTWRVESIGNAARGQVQLSRPAEHAVSGPVADRQERQGNHRLRFGGWNERPHALPRSEILPDRQ